MNAFTPSIVKKTEETASISKAYPNRRSRKNKYNSGQKPFVRTRRRNKKKLVYNGCKQRKELL